MQQRRKLLSHLKNTLENNFMQRFCLALDLIDDADSIREYEQYHAPGSAWPEVTQHDLDAGILNIEIFMNL